MVLNDRLEERTLSLYGDAGNRKLVKSVKILGYPKFRTIVHYTSSLTLLQFASLYSRGKNSIMKQLWSPWRMSYIEDPNKKFTCVFCLEENNQDDEKNLVVYRGLNVYVILNRFPYTNGHLMVVPYQHQTSLDTFPQETLTEMIGLISRCIRVLREDYSAQGFNVGANIGSAAGAGIPDHFHFHVVPRWGGDTNFMTAIGETRVVPEALEDTYLRIKEAWKKYQKIED